MGVYNPHEPLAGLYSPKSSHVQLAQPQRQPPLQGGGGPPPPPPVVQPAVRYQNQSNVIYGKPKAGLFFQGLYTVYILTPFSLTKNLISTLKNFRFDITEKD